MLRYHGIFRSLIKIHQNTSKLPGHIFRYDSLTEKFVSADRKWLKVWFFLLASVGCINFINLMSNLMHGSLVDYSFSFVNLIGIVCATCYLYFNSFTRNDETTTDLLNGFLKLERTFEKDGQLNNLEKRSFAKFICQLFVLTESTIPWLFGIGAGLMPCSQLNLLAVLNPVCSLTSGSESTETRGFLMVLLKGIELLTFGIANGMISKATLGTGILVCVHILAACLCQKSSLEIFFGKYAKMGMSQFRIYRQLQLLNKYFNEAHVGVIFITMMTCSLVQTCVAYVIAGILTTATPTLSVPVVFVDLALLVDTTLISLYIFGKAGEVYSLSSGVLIKAQSSTLNRSTRARKVRLKFFKSCAPLKVYFGINNFIEKETPLKFLNFSIDRFVDLLLLGTERYA
ncbi:unnamed protein product [Orchesella dallaii]|uniref:Odorant receptor n=1 Tax=Orchesella dallaii TaxID=48710 RepID=A0ABP1S6Z2_9HEXA